MFLRESTQRRRFHHVIERSAFWQAILFTVADFANSSCWHHQFELVTSAVVIKSACHCSGLPSRAATRPWINYRPIPIVHLKFCNYCKVIQNLVGPTMGSLHSIGASPSTTLWGVHGNGETRMAEDRSWKGQEGEVLKEAMLPSSPSASGSGKRCKFILCGPGRSPGDLSIRTFSRLTNRSWCRFCWH